MRVTRVPEPALIRSVLVTVTAVIAYLVGHQIDVGWIDAALTLYTLVSSVVAGALIRPAVTPVQRPDNNRHVAGAPP